MQSKNTINSLGSEFSSQGNFHSREHFPYPTLSAEAEPISKGHSRSDIMKQSLVMLLGTMG